MSLLKCKNKSATLNNLIFEIFSFKVNDWTINLRKKTSQILQAENSIIDRKIQ